jgi:polysaccharide export outer membrane protein
MRQFSLLVAILSLALICSVVSFATQDPVVQHLQDSGKNEGELRSTYVLGADDVIVIRSLIVEEISEKPIRISPSGYVNLPMVGRVRAAGFTLEQLEDELVRRLDPFFKNPTLGVSIVEFRSQPVSVIGAVTNPGVLQLQGNKTLVEIIAMAGGLRADAGNTVKITRKKKWGAIPLPGSRVDSSGNFNVAEVNLNAVTEAVTPEQNIAIRPEDIIAVARGELVYVIGEVRKPGGFVLHERESVSVLKALALAEGLERTAAPQNARILRPERGADRRVEVPVDLKRVLSSKSPDVALQPDDILFIPGSTGKRAALRTIEALISAGTTITTGAVVYRR